MHSSPIFDHDQAEIACLESGSKVQSKAFSNQPRNPQELAITSLSLNLINQMNEIMNTKIYTNRVIS